MFDRAALPNAMLCVEPAMDAGRSLREKKNLVRSQYQTQQVGARPSNVVGVLQTLKTTKVLESTFECRLVEKAPLHERAGKEHALETIGIYMYT